MFVDESKNFLTSCKECYDDVQAYWLERWDDYYAGLM